MARVEEALVGRLLEELLLATAEGKWRRLGVLVALLVGAASRRWLEVVKEAVVATRHRWLVRNGELGELAERETLLGQQGQGEME